MHRAPLFATFLWWVVRRYRDEHERGATIVLVALCAVFIFGMVGLGIDMALFHNARSHAQNAADHAATTAAHAECVLNLGVGAARNAGEDRALANGYSGAGDNTVSINPEGDGWRAVITRTVDTAFAGIIGWSELDTSVSTLAKCNAGGSGGPGAIHAGGDCNGGKWSLDMSGQSAEVIGGVYARGDVSIASNQGDYFVEDPPVEPLDTFEYSGILKPDSTSGNFFDVDQPDNVAAKDWPEQWGPGDVSPLLSAYEDLADENGPDDANDTLFDTKITQITKDGVYYTTSSEGMDISVITGITRNVVLVAPNGPIKISASTSGQTMSALTDDQLDLLPDFVGDSFDLPRAGILMLSNLDNGSVADKCSKYSLNISGQNSTWNGIMWAPGGLIEFAGSDNVSANGSLVGFGVKTSGFNISIHYNPDLFQGEDFILIME